MVHGLIAVKRGRHERTKKTRRIYYWLHEPQTSNFDFHEDIHEHTNRLLFVQVCLPGLKTE